MPYHKRPDPPCDGRSQLATAPCEPGDEQEGTWPRDQLVRMDARFWERLELRDRTRKGTRRMFESNTPVNALSFTDQQLVLLRELAAPLSPKQRRRFLDLVMKYLAGCEVGDATVHMAGIRAQTELRREQPWLNV